MEKTPPIESGIPLVVGLPKHVVAAFGHTFDVNGLDDLSVKNGIASTAGFCSGLIVNDDNFQPYQHLGLEKTPESKYSFKDIDSFIVPLPEKVFLGAEDFEEVALKVLAREDIGYDALSEQLREEALICRMFLTTVKSFKKKLAERGMGHESVESVYRDIPLPHFIWICEISTREEYKRGNVLGEIIWDATRNSHEPDGWIAIHYPEKLMFDAGSALNQPQEIQTLNLTGAESYPLYRSNLEEIRS